MRARVLIAVIYGATFFALVNSSAYPVSAKKEKGTVFDKKKDIKKIRKELSEKEKLIERLKSKEVSILGMIEDLNFKMNSDMERLSALNNEKRNVLATTEKIKPDVENLQSEIATQKIAIKEKLRSSYKSGKFSFLKILLASNSYSDFLKKRYYLRELIESENRMLLAYLGSEEDLKNKLVLMQDKMAYLETLSRETQLKLNSIKQVKTEKLAVLKAVKSEKDLEIKSANELAEAARNLEKMIQTIAKSEELKGGAFELKRGVLLMPVRGKIVVKYGEYVEGNFNVSIFSKGLSMNVDNPSAVKSIFDGKVIYAGLFRGYGNIIIVDHGESYYSLYALLQSINKKVGEKVSQGEEIGMVGGGDSIQGSKLYFELRHNGLTVDPMPWFANKNGLR